MSVAAALLVAPVPAASAASPSATVVVSGILGSHAGSGTAGIVELQAWPDPLPRTLGATIAMVPVAVERTAPGGEYAFTEAQIESSAHAAELRAINAQVGHVNFEILGATPRATGAYDFSRSLRNGSWQREGGDPTNAAQIKTTLPETTADYGAAQALVARGINPADPSPQCRAQLIAQKGQTARVGEMHRRYGVQNYFYYGQSKHAESHLGIGISDDGQHWSGDAGTVYITDSGSRTENRLLNTINGQYDVSSFWWEKYHFSWNGVGLRCVNYQVRAAYWQSGYAYGRVFNNTLDGLCQYEAHRVPAAAGGNAWKYSSAAYNYHYAISIWGASLTGQSGWSTNVESEFKFLRNSWYCGEDGQAPTYAKAIAVGGDR